MFTRIVLALVITFVPFVVDAQTHWDVTGTTGLFTGYTPSGEAGRGYQELWFEGVQGGAILGRHLTTNLKLELEASATSAGTQFRERLITVPGSASPYPIGSEVSTSVRSISTALTWQFRRNEWVHPFVQAGVSTDFDRVTVRTWEQFLYGGTRPGTVPERVVEERIDGPHTTVHVRALLGAGAKLYFTPRAFMRTDARWSFDRNRHNLAFRAGVGVDL